MLTMALMIGGELTMALMMGGDGGGVDDVDDVVDDGVDDGR